MKWIGMVHVRPSSRLSVLSAGAKGAYGNVVAIARSESDYKEIVSTLLMKDGLSVIDFSDVATYEDYVRDDNLSEYLSYLLGALSDEYPVQFHTFFNYSTDDT